MDVPGAGGRLVPRSVWAAPAGLTRNTDHNYTVSDSAMINGIFSPHIAQTMLAQTLLYIIEVNDCFCDCKKYCTSNPWRENYILIL